MVDTMAWAACARSSKDLIFTETVRKQIKEVGKTAGRIYDHMEWVDKAHTNSVTTLEDLLHSHVQQWSTAMRSSPASPAPTYHLERHAQAGAGLHAHVLGLSPPAPIYQAPPSYEYPSMWGNASGAPHYAHPPAPVNLHDPNLPQLPL
jgi:hypothetical protein